MAYKIIQGIREYDFVDESAPETVLFTVYLQGMPVINSFVEYSDSGGNVTTYKVEKSVLKVQQVAAVPDDTSPPTTAGYEEYFTAKGKIELSVVP